MKTYVMVAALAANLLCPPALASLDGALMMYSDGEYEEAFKEFHQLARQGNLRAQYSLGHLYANGYGVEQDIRKAVEWYLKAADQGYVHAQYSLGLVYMLGEHIPQDYAQAAHWFRKAAAQGDARSMNNLGALYEDGLGVPQSRVIAYALYNLSAEMDSSPGTKAPENRQLVARRMSVQEVNAARTLSGRLKGKGRFLSELESAEGGI